jgi:hypothetical protein
MLDRIQTVTSPEVQRFRSLEELLKLEEEIVEEGLNTGACYARLMDTILYMYKCLECSKAEGVPHEKGDGHG